MPAKKQPPPGFIWKTQITEGTQVLWHHRASSVNVLVEVDEMEKNRLKASLYISFFIHSCKEHST